MMPMQNLAASFFSRRRRPRKHSFLLWISPDPIQADPALPPAQADDEAIAEDPSSQKTQPLHSKLPQQKTLRPSRKETEIARRKKQRTTESIAELTKRR